MSHTPGPWKVDSDRPSGQLVVVSGFGEVAQVFGGENPDDETMPNAILIAMAPELLDACQQGCAALKAHHERGGVLPKAIVDAWCAMTEAVAASGGAL